MKTNALLFFVFLFAILTARMDAQSNLFMGLTSGMSKDQVLSHIKSHPDNFTLLPGPDGRTLNEIKGRIYFTTPQFNSKNELFIVTLLCTDNYEWTQYKPNITEIVSELFTLLKIKYGDPVYDELPNRTEIPEGKYKGVCIFEKGTIQASIIIGLDDFGQNYYVMSVLQDEKYSEEEPQDTPF